MNTRISIVAAIAFLLTSAVAVDPAAAISAHPLSTHTAALAPRSGEGRAFSFSGRVESVDYASNVIVVRTKGETLTIAITPTTSVEQQGQFGSIADLRPGVHVRIKGSTRDGQMTAESIIIK